MNVKIPSEQQVLHEGAQALLKSLGPAKAARFWAAMQKGEGDYLALKDTLFEGKDVETLYAEIAEFQTK
jgi:N-dimethylarginine dimethylaminohydrolase